ncbi:hypothetical protein [Amycolatopsis sp. cmx-4-68]|uniref:hypothetical protein n=1 Tax=Amycolatopsis sp. cmx-4-68 TaxID=2790938 RepID=UPI00397C1866
MAELQLRKDTADDALHTAGSVTYRVYDGDRWVGWVGDGRRFNGARYGGRLWWACWREDGDAAARWSTGLRYAKRQDAVDDIQIGDLRLTYDEAEQLIVRIRNAIAYERGRTGHPLLIAIDADCPSCHYPERSLNPVTGVFGCTQCVYTSTERNA